MMSPRTGRPKSDSPKNKSIKIRFDDGSYDKLLEYCEKHGISRTEAIRKAVDLLVMSEK